MTTGALDAPDPAAQHPLLVTTEWLARHLDDPRLVLIDMAEALAFERAHIPGAVRIPHHPWLKSEADPNLVVGAADFEALVRRAGVSNESVVVLYDDHLNRLAARGWWAFARYGFEGARVLDGGIHAWIAEGRPVTQAVRTPPPGDFAAKPIDDRVCSLKDMRDALHPAAGVQIWDVRSDAEWEGFDGRNRRGGHVPGAVHLEWSRFIEDGPARRFIPLADARRLLEAHGINPEAVTVTY